MRGYSANLRVTFLAAAFVLLNSAGCSSLRAKFDRQSGNNSNTSGSDRAALAGSARTKMQSAGTITGGLTEKPSVQSERVSLMIDLFAARGFLEGSDYERYVLKGSTLWRECGGVLQRNKRGATARAASGRASGGKAFKEDPNLVAVESHVETLTKEQLDSISEHAQGILSIPEKQKLNAPLPGSVFSLTQPGIFELGVSMGKISNGDQIQTGRLVTSVDAVADRDSHRVATDRAYRLFRALRSVGPVMCKSKTFFGVGRESVGRE